MKPDRAASEPPERPEPPAVAGSAQARLPVTPAERARLAILHLAGMVGVVLLLLGAASLLSLACVRVGFDLWAGIDPFLPPGRRPFLGAVELAHRAFAVDALRQVFLAGLVLGLARWRAGPGWRARLGLGRTNPDDATPDGLRPAALLAILLVWPALHIAWVSGTAELFGAGFGRHVQVSPFLSRTALAAWLVYLAVLAPVAEELLMRGEAFARVRAALGPAAAMLATALVFCAAHLSGFGLARPVSLLPLALALGWLRWRTGRLWPCMALHGWSNLALVTYLLWPG